MAFHVGLRANSVRRTGLGTAIAGFGTCALMLYGYWGFRVSGPSPTQTLGLLIGLAIWVAIGAAAGLVSGRFRDAPASWVAASIGLLLAYWIFYSEMFPGSPYPGEDGFEGDLVPIVVFLFVVITGGHLLGVLATRPPGRRRYQG